MPKKLLLTFVAFAFVGVLAFGAAWAASPQSVALPQAISADTPCPVAGCTQPDGGCHAASPAPEPDGTFLMVCPRIDGCSDAKCHAWERIDSLRSKPSDAAMNLWIIAPVVFVLALVLIVKKVR